jgi:hypothetical protein
VSRADEGRIGDTLGAASELEAVVGRGKKLAPREAPADLKPRDHRADSQRPSVMQVRPPSVVSGAAWFDPIARSSVNGQVDVLAGGQRKSSRSGLVAGGAVGEPVAVAGGGDDVGVVAEPVEEADGGGLVG